MAGMMDTATTNDTTAQPSQQTEQARTQSTATTTRKDPPPSATAAQERTNETNVSAAAAAASNSTGTATSQRQTNEEAIAVTAEAPLIDLNEWDQRWEEQYDRRKRRKVIADALVVPPLTIGRADDPIRLPAGPCTCPPNSSCHLNEQCPCNYMGLYCTETCQCNCGSNHSNQGTAATSTTAGEKQRQCKNSLAHADERHKQLVAAIQNGHRPVVHECCPCAPVCRPMVRVVLFVLGRDFLPRLFYYRGIDWTVGLACLSLFPPRDSGM